MASGGGQPRLGRAGIQRRTLLTHDEYLGQRLELHAIVRFVVAGLIVIGAWFARTVVGVEGLDVRGLSLVGLGIFVYNLLILAVVHPRRDPVRAERSLGLLRVVLYGSMVLDYVVLTVAIWLVGGSRSPFLAFYLFHVIIASLLLSRSAAWGAALLAWLLLSILVIGEHRGVIPTHEVLGAIPDLGGGVDERYLFTVLAVYGVLFLVTAALLTSISEILRRGERSCRDNICELERLSEMRRDFLHITTHNLQSPVGAATMLLANLDDGLCGDLNDKQHVQVGRALKRLEGLTVFLGDLRMLTQLEVEDLAEQAELVDVRVLLGELVEAHTDRAGVQGHRIELEVGEQTAAVWTNRRLLGEAVVNYITNAIKYTPVGGVITVRARMVDGVGVGGETEESVGRTDLPKSVGESARRSDLPKSVRIEVIDNGIGIGKKDQKRLFEELVRIKTDHPELGQVKGTGLGLSIVRRVVSALGGRGGVESEVGRGSCFWIEIPAG